MFFRKFSKDGKRNGDGLPREADAERVADALARDPRFAEHVANLVSHECLERFAQAMSKTFATWQDTTTTISQGVTQPISHTTSKAPK